MKNILHLLRGRQGEALAARHLKNGGLEILDKNIRIGGGELDLVCRDGATVVFVEVRLRRAGAPVSAAESITPAKRQKWRRAAAAWLQRHHPADPPDCRFDAVCVSRRDDGGSQIDWLRGVDV